MEDPNDKTVVLGQPRAIPYSTQIVTQAWNELAGQSLSTIAPTKVRVKIRFKNSRCKIRAIRSWGSTLWQYSIVLTDRQIYNGPTFNNIERLYEQNLNTGSLGRAFWYAATGNNALHEFYGFASSDGISAPPGGLDILLTPADEAEAAPMLGKLLNPWATISIPAFIFVFIKSPAAVLAPLTAYLSAFAPDVVYNHDGEGNRASDQVKDTWYHEFAHAAHFNGLNNDSYWIGNIKYVIDNDGMGDGTAPGAGRCAVIEMWGFHYGPVCADRQYGVLHSNGGAAAQQITARRHIFLLESFIPTLPPTLNNRWMAQGAFLDLIDDNALNPPGVFDGIGPETVTGFTHANCFSAICTAPPNPTAVRNILTGSFLPPGQTVVGVNGVFAAYGF